MNKQTKWIGPRICPQPCEWAADLKAIVDKLDVEAYCGRVVEAFEEAAMFIEAWFRIARDCGGDILLKIDWHVRVGDGPPFVKRLQVPDIQELDRTHLTAAAVGQELGMEARRELRASLAALPQDGANHESAVCLLRMIDGQYRKEERIHTRKAAEAARKG